MGWGVHMGTLNTTGPAVPTHHQPLTLATLSLPYLGLSPAKSGSEGALSIQNPPRLEGTLPQGLNQLRRMRAGQAPSGYG